MGSARARDNAIMAKGTRVRQLQRTKSHTAMTNDATHDKALTEDDATLVYKVGVYVYDIILPGWC